MSPIVIVGSGLAGYTLLKEIRKRDTVTPVTLVTADDGAFYSKPNLSNALAAGQTAATSTISKSAFETPQSGHSQLSGTSSQRVPGAMPCSGSPFDSS